MMIKARHFVSAVTIAAIALLLAPKAEAASITISDGVNLPVIIADGDLYDSAPVTGAINYSSFSLGVFNLTLATGLTKPVVGSAEQPEMYLLVTAQSTAAGTLTVSFTDDGFGPSSAFGRLSLTASSFSSSNAISYALLQNNENAGGIVWNGINGTPLNGTAVLPQGGAAPYSLTQVVSITHSGASNSQVTATASVPDGGMTLVLLGGALVGLGALRRRFNL